MSSSLDPVVPEKNRGEGLHTAAWGVCGGLDSASAVVLLMQGKD